MKTCYACHQEKPLSEYYKAKGYRDGHHNMCKCCELAYAKNRRKVEGVPEAQRLSAAKWRANNPERAREVSRKSAAKLRSENPEKFRERDRNKVIDPSKRKIINQRYYERNKEKIAARNKDYNSRNPHCQSSRKARRRAAEFNAKVSWANDFFIKEIYHLAKTRSKVTGFSWHVDHIVPLNSKVVCGLHVESNLQVIPAKQNASKSNLFWPDM